MTIQEKYQLALEAIQNDPACIEPFAETIRASIEKAQREGKLPDASGMDLSIGFAQRDLQEEPVVALVYTLTKDGEVVHGPAFGAEFLITKGATEMPSTLSDAQLRALKQTESEIVV